VLQRVAVAETEFCGGTEMNEAELRQLSAEALAAADELSQLSGTT
jgi:hypothetical protein